MKPFWIRTLPYIAAVAIALIGLFIVYSHGQSVTEAKWQAKWSHRDAMDALAKAVNESNERAKEQARQQSLNRVIEDGQKIIDQAVADAVVARADLSVRIAADNLADSISVKQAGGYSCTATASQAATRAVLVLADVFKRADQRAGDLAADADQSRGRGVTCVRSYEGVKGIK